MAILLGAWAWISGLTEAWGWIAGPAGAGISLVGAFLKSRAKLIVLAIGALVLVGGGVWIFVAMKSRAAAIDVLRAKNEAAETLRLAAEGQRNAAVDANKRHEEALRQIRLLAERREADVRAELDRARRENARLERDLQEIARDPDADATVPPIVDRFLDGVRARRQARGADAGGRDQSDGGAGAGRPVADGVRRGADGTVGRAALARLPHVGAQARGGAPRLPEPKPLHRPAAAGEGVPGAGGVRW